MSVNFTQVLPVDPIINIFSNLDRAARGVVARVNKACRDIVRKMDSMGMDYVHRIAEVLSKQPHDETQTVPEIIEAELINQKVPSYAMDIFNIQHVKMELDNFRKHTLGDEEVPFDMSLVWRKMVSLGYFKAVNPTSMLEVFKLMKDLVCGNFLNAIKDIPCQLMRFAFISDYLANKSVPTKEFKQLLSVIKDDNLKYLCQYQLITTLVDEEKFGEAIELEKKLEDSQMNTTNTKSQLQHLIFTNLLGANRLSEARKYMESIPDPTIQGLMSLMMPQG